MASGGIKNRSMKNPMTDAFSCPGNFSRTWLYNSLIITTINLFEVGRKNKDFQCWFDFVSCRLFTEEFCVANF